MTDIVLPWDKKRLRDDSRLIRSILFLQEKEIPSFVYDKPAPKTAERVRGFTEQLCEEEKKWIVCFGTDAIYDEKLFYYILASFVLSAKCTAEIATPKKLIEFAFDYRNNDIQLFGESSTHSFKICELLIIPYFDPLYPGYQKARPRITELLKERKLQKKLCIIELFVLGALPTTLEESAKHTPALLDIVGKEARGLFQDGKTNFLTVKAEKL